MGDSAPLPSGWTEHVGPQSQPYYYNQSTGQSTYDRPSNTPSSLPPFDITNGASSSLQAGTFNANSSQTSIQADSSSQNGVQADTSSKPKKKEKPAKKEQIPGAAGWLKVTTNMGNVFYTHVESKRSEWTIPDEIKEYVQLIEDEERRIRLLEEEDRRLVKEQEEEERRLAKEKERLKRQQEEEEELERRKEELRKREEAVKKQRAEREQIQKERMRVLEEQGKRKRMEGRDEEDASTANESGKRVRLDDRDEEDDDELEWQRQMAAEMAAEAEVADAEADESVSPPPIPIAAPLADASISLDEQKTLFMHMLTSLIGTSNEVNPMAPWGRELPKFVHERDYTVLKSVRDRQDAFNEWCKLRLREKRKMGTGTIKPSGVKLESQEKTNGASDIDISTGDASEQYRLLLEAEVKSTRTKWEDFKKSWRKDRRFFLFGRDDREREKVFRDWLKELGERKRKAAEQADENFIILLEEYLGSEHRLEVGTAKEQVQSAWIKAKKVPRLEKDARYEAVGSSSRRAELFGEWAQGSRMLGQRENSGSNVEDTKPKVESGTADAATRALLEREEAVEKKRREMDVQKQRAFDQATRDESITIFKQLLIDAVRDPLLSVTSAMHSISDDGRFRTQGLQSAEKERLVYDHIEDLNHKRLGELQMVFERHAPSLDIEVDVALPLIRDDDEIERRHLKELKVLQSRRKNLEDLFKDWNRERNEQAYKSFQQMLKENAFVNFWGRLRQEYEQRISDAKDGKQNGTRQGEDEEDDDDEPDLLQMAGNFDLEEIHSILRNDQRYRAFRHEPEKRNDWIRRHLQTMKVPKKTVYQRDH